MACLSLTDFVCLCAQVGQLVEEVQKLQAIAAKQQTDFHARVSRLEDELARRDEQLSALNKTLALQSDYQELRKELQYVLPVTSHSHSWRASLLSSLCGLSCQ